MKPVHVGMLVAAAALGGAFFMKVVNQPEPAAPPAVTASAPAPAPEPAAPATPAAEPAVPEPVKPAPVPVREAVPARRARAKPTPVQTARVEPPARVPAETPAAETKPAVQPPAEPAPPAAPEAPVTAEPSLESKVLKPAELPAPPPRQVTLAAGTLVPVRLVETLASDRMSAGDTFSATLDAPLVVDSLVIAERGARLQGRVVNLEAGGRVRGVSALGIELVSLRTSDGQTVKIQTDTFQRQAEREVAKDAAKVGVAAGIGAAIGAIAGGGKGAGIGAAVGGAAGTGGVLATRGKPVVIPSETKIGFRLSQPVILTERK